MSKELIVRLREAAAQRVASTAMIGADDLIAAAYALESLEAAYSGAVEAGKALAKQAFKAEQERDGLALRVSELTCKIDRAEEAMVERDALAAELKSLREQEPPADIDPHDAMLQKQHDEAQGPLANAAHKVYFRAGLLACREHMARFVESQDPSIAASIRANWWPDLGPDMGPPRRIEWGELTEGEYGESGFRVKEPHEISPTIEALPIAQHFLTPDEGTTK